MSLDPRIASALTTDVSALGLLNQLHQQIVVTTDSNTLVTLLGTYTAAAAIRAGRRRSPPLPSAVTSTTSIPWTTTTFQMESKMLQAISNILKAVNEQANTVITNIKA